METTLWLGSPRCEGLYVLKGQGIRRAEDHCARRCGPTAMTTKGHCCHGHQGRGLPPQTGILTELILLEQGSMQSCMTRPRFEPRLNSKEFATKAFWVCKMGE